MRPAQSLDAYRPVVAPIESFLYGQAGTQRGDPAKAAEMMAQVVDNKTSPFRLMLGSDAYELWDRTIAARNTELAAWRARGEATAFDDAPMIAIGAH